MKSNFLYRVRWELVKAFLLSAAFSIAPVMVVYQISKIILIYVRPFRAPLAWVVNHIGSVPVIFGAGSVLFIGFFFFFTWRMLSDLFNGMAQKLQEGMEHERAAEKSKNELIIGVSHDLRTPLTSILGYLELIETDRYKDEVELRYYTNVAYEKAKRLKKLIDELFEYTSMSGGDIKLHLQKVNINVLLKQLAEEFVPQFTKAGMCCRFNEDNEELYVYADSNRLIRTYENLIVNAIRYGSKGKYVDIGIKRDHHEAVVSIANFGESISDRDLPYIFERFYRADKSRTSENGGTGLGLAIAKSIIDAHGGQISARSSRLETIFETRLPLVDEGKTIKV